MSSRRMQKCYNPSVAQSEMPKRDLRIISLSLLSLNSIDYLDLKYQLTGLCLF